MAMDTMHVRNRGSATGAGKAEIVDIILTLHPDGEGSQDRLAVFILRQSDGLRKYIVGVHANGKRFAADEIRQLWTDTPANWTNPFDAGGNRVLAAAAGDHTSNMGVGGTPPLEPEPEGISPKSLDDLGVSLIGSFDLSDSLR